MSASIILGSLGTFLMFLWGRDAGFDTKSCLSTLILSDFVGIVCVLSLLWMERYRWIKAYWLSSFARSWLTLGSSYLLAMSWIEPRLFESTAAFKLFLPLLLAQGFAFPVFGLLRDTWVQMEARSR